MRRRSPMIRLTRLLLTLTALVSLAIASPHRTPQAQVRSSTNTLAASIDTSTPIPLPGGCGGGLPPDEVPPICGGNLPPSEPCCISGYVFVDGQPVQGAKVTIHSLQGDLIVW